MREKPKRPRIYTIKKIISNEVTVVASLYHTFLGNASEVSSDSQLKDKAIKEFAIRQESKIAKDRYDVPFPSNLERIED